MECALQNQFFGGLRKSGLCPFPLKKRHAVDKGGGERIIGGGGSKIAFGEGVYGRFSPLLSFPPPFAALRT